MNQDPKFFQDHPLAAICAAGLFTLVVTATTSKATGVFAKKWYSRKDKELTKNL